MKLLIHHHNIAYQENGTIWIQNSMGRWINELAKHFEEIGLLLFESQSKSYLQDYGIKAKNVKLVTLGIANKGSKWERIRNIKNITNSESSNYDALIIRGITPKQYIVFNNAYIQKKYFILVGSIDEYKPKFKFDRISLIEWTFQKLRVYEFGRIAQKASRIFANSPAIVDQVRKRFKVEPLFVPTNSIGLDSFVPLKVKSIQQPISLLFCARVLKDKGIEEIIEAVAILKEKAIITKLQIVGSINDLYYKFLVQKVLDLGLENSVDFIGFVSFGKELLNFYRQADIYVLPTWHEGFPKTIWEAAASCTPIITTSVGGIPGIVSDKEVSFVKTRDAEDIARVVESFSNGTLDYSEKVQNAYRLALEFTIEKCAENLHLQIRLNSLHV